MDPGPDLSRRHVTRKRAECTLRSVLEAQKDKADTLPARPARSFPGLSSLGTASRSRIATERGNALVGTRNASASCEQRQ
jgi:hypothetical protein